MGHTKRVKLLGPVLVAAFSLWLLLIGIQNAAAAPGPTDNVWLDGSPNPLMPVDVAVNPETGLVYVVNQGAGHVWVISGTEYVTTIDPPPETPEGGCPGPTPYGPCLNSVNVSPFTGKAYVTQWVVDLLRIISNTELIDWVYGGQGPAGTVMHPYTDTVYALAKWCWGRHGVTVIKGDDDKVLVPGPFADAGCVNPVNGYAYIPNPFVDEVLVIDDSIPIAGIPVGSYPNGAACSESGHVYIVNSGSTPATVSVITGTQVIADIPVGQSTTNLGVDCMWGTKLPGSADIVAVNEYMGYVYVSNWFSDTVSVINDTTWITDVAVGGRPNSIGVYTPTNTVYVANVFSDSVSAISGTEVIATIPVGDYPIALDVNSDNGYVYVVNSDSDSVSIIHGTEVVATIGRLRPQALTAQGGRVYSANSNGTVSVVEGADLPATIAVGDDPQALIGDGTYLYVANADSASVSVISGTSPITTLAVGANPRALTVYTPTNRVYVANVASDTVSVLNSLAIETTIAVGGGPSALAVDPASGDIFVANTLSNTVTVINGILPVGNVQVGGGPQALAFNQANGYAYVANSVSATVSVLDGTTLLTTRPVSGTPTAVAAHPGTGYVYVAARDDDVVNVLQGTNVMATIPVGDQPNAIAVDRDLGFVYVTCEGSDQVWVLSGTISLDLDFEVGDRPVDVVVEPVSGEGYVANHGDASLSRIQNLPPTISSAAPDRTEVGRSITTTLNGSGYFLTPTVWLSSTLIENVQRLDRTALTVQVPGTLSGGEYTITARTADGLTGTKANGFTVTQRAPTVTAISPTSSANHLTTTVRITGGDFISLPTSSVGDVVLQNVTWQSSEVITAEMPPGLAPGRYQTIFFDNVEQSTDHWSPGSVWRLTYSDYHSANRAWHYAGDGWVYGALHLDSPLDLTAIPHPQLSFWERRNGRWDDGRACVELSTNDGASWHELEDCATSSTNWQQTTLDLSAYATSPSAMLRFRIDGYLSDAGWYVDDIHVGGMPDGLLVTNPGPGRPTGYLTAPFTVTNRADHFAFDPISSPQVAGEPFTVTITARDAFGYSAQDYVGTTMLSATAPISPAIAGPFSSGAWSGLVQIDAIQTDVIITATDTISEAISGSSAPFDISTLRAHRFVFDSISSPQVKGQPFTVTIAARDILSYLVQTYTGTVALSATAPISPTATDPFTHGVWSGLVQIDAAQTNVVITATDMMSAGISDGSIPFDVCALPETTVSWIPTNPVASQVVTFNISVAPDAALPISYTWDFGDYRPLYGACYGPYRAGQNPEQGLHPCRDEIREDMNILDDFTSRVRIYTARDIATDVIQLAAERGISVTLGAWIDADDATNALEIASLISLTNQYTNVTAVVVGNERILFNEIPKYRLISYINQVQQAVSVPVSTAEPWSVWLESANQDLVDAVDYLLVHIHPFWESASPDDAVDDVVQRYNEVRTKYPDKPLIIGETGWPSAGSDVGNAHPGLAEQQRFVEDFVVWAADNDVQYFYFEAFDEPWKCGGSEGDVGCHWGLFTEERWPKPAIGPSLTTTSTIVTYTYKSGGDHTVRVKAENACGQAAYSVTVSVCQPITAVHILGPSTVFTGTMVEFTADYEPDGATTPITLTWDNGAVGESASYTWNVAGTHVVAVTATNRCGSFVTDTHPITIHHTARIEFAPDRIGSVDPGSTITYTHTIINGGNYTDTFDLTHLSSQNWLVKYDTPVSVGYGQTARVVISITAPVGVISGTVDTTIVTATSQADNSAWDSITDTTIIKGKPRIYVPLIFRNW